MKKIIVLFLLLLFNPSFSYGKVTQIVVWESLYNEPNSIIVNYLHKALELTKPEYGDYELLASPKMEQGRAVLELTKHKKPQLDLATYAPTAEREKQAIAIRIPLLNGLMGYRLCLINKKKQTLFDGIQNKQQLISKNITIRQHQDWPDTTVLRTNNINVQTSHRKDLLFQQLARGRFDCFSRGASEIYAEYLAHRSLGIEIEKQLLIYYPLPLFFFVNKSRPLLAERLQLGLERLIASGEFATIFDQFFAPIILNLKLADRLVIDLHNPTLSPKTVTALKAPTQSFRTRYFQKSDTFK